MNNVHDRELANAEFKGYVTRALENIDTTLKSVDKKMDVLDRCVNGMKVRVAAIGGTISLVVTVLVLLLSKIIS